MSFRLLCFILDSVGLWVFDVFAPVFGPRWPRARSGAHTRKPTSLWLHDRKLFQRFISRWETIRHCSWIAVLAVVWDIPFGQCDAASNRTIFWVGCQNRQFDIASYNGIDQARILIDSSLQVTTESRPSEWTLGFCLWHWLPGHFDEANAIFFSLRMFRGDFTSGESLATTSSKSSEVLGCDLFLSLYLSPNLDVNPRIHFFF